MTRGETARAGGRVALIVLGVVAVLAVLALVITVVSGSVSWITAPFRGAVAEREQTQGSGEYRIANYDAFLRDCNAVVAAEGDVDDAAANVAGLPPSIASQNLQAALSTRRTLVAGYNDRASREATAGQFRDSRLPYQLPTTYQAGGVKTTCAA